MLIRLDAPYVDVRASDLSLAIGLEPLPALQTLLVSVGGWGVELRLLGCSHQTLVRAPGISWSETVACRPGVAGDLPERRTERGSFGTYSFQAQVEVLDHGRGAAVAEAASTDPHGLVGLFGGPAGAFTALRLREQETGVAWTTWHAYPQSDELVITESRLAR
ncbi:MAG: DUF2617 family protein [Solirubrobacterales bacterium]|nr:DUF2617 family protein [Solirubrobacterales bacterium]